MFLNLLSNVLCANPFHQQMVRFVWGCLHLLQAFQKHPWFVQNCSFILCISNQSPGKVLNFDCALPRPNYQIVHICCHLLCLLWCCSLRFKRRCWRHKFWYNLLWFGSQLWTREIKCFLSCLLPSTSSNVQSCINNQFIQFTIESAPQIQLCRWLSASIL